VQLDGTKNRRVRSEDSYSLPKPCKPQRAEATGDLAEPNGRVEYLPPKSTVSREATLSQPDLNNINGSNGQHLLDDPLNVPAPAAVPLLPPTHHQHIIEDENHASPSYAVSTAKFNLNPTTPPNPHHSKTINSPPSRPKKPIVSRDQLIPNALHLHSSTTPFGPDTPLDKKSTSPSMLNVPSLQMPERYQCTPISVHEPVQVTRISGYYNFTMYRQVQPQSLPQSQQHAIPPHQQYPTPQDAQHKALVTETSPNWNTFIRSPAPSPDLARSSGGWKQKE